MIYGMKDYPIFDENYREVLNNKIFNHFKFREIGFETAELFKHFLNTTMNEIMPFYNKLYNSKVAEYNPFYNKIINENYQRTTDGTSENRGTSNSNSNGSSNGDNIYSDTPQSGLLIDDIKARKICN